MCFFGLISRSPWWQDINVTSQIIQSLFRKTKFFWAASELNKISSSILFFFLWQSFQINSPFILNTIRSLWTNITKLGSALNCASTLRFSLYCVFSRLRHMTGLFLTCESAACDSRRRLFGSRGWRTPCVGDSALSDRDLWWRPDLRGETRCKLHLRVAKGRLSWNVRRRGSSSQPRRRNWKQHQDALLFFFQPADSCVALTEAGRKIMSWRKKVHGRKNGKRHEVNVEFSTVLSCLMRTVLSKRRPHLLPNQSPTPTWRLWQRGTDGWCPGWQKIRAAHWLRALCHFTRG